MDVNYNSYSSAGESAPLALIKGILGAIVGALPCAAGWILLSKVGYIVPYIGIGVGFLSVLAYAYMTRKSDLPAWVGWVICAVILIPTAVMLVRVSWTWKLQDYLMSDYQDKIFADLSAQGYKWGEIQSALEIYMEENFGFTDVTFSNCFHNFDKLVEAADIKGDYIFKVIISLICVCAGGFVTAKEFVGKGRFEGGTSKNE